MALNSEILVRLTAVQTGPNDFGGARNTPAMQALIQLASGTGANQADILFMDERTVASATNDDLDLAGVLADAFGATVAAAEMVALFVINAPRSGAPNTTDLTIGLGTNPFLGFLGGTNPTLGPIGPGGAVLLQCPDAGGLGAVAGGSTDILRIANGSGAAATYQIAILARTA